MPHLQQSSSPTLKFPVRPSPQRANGERQKPIPQAKPRPLRSGSNGHDAGDPATFRIQGISPARGVTVDPAKQDAAQRSNTRNPLTNPDPKLSAASHRDSLVSTPNTQGSP